MPVFSFEKLADVCTHLGPEMKSTGEVLGVGRTMWKALFKGLIATGYRMACGAAQNAAALAGCLDSGFTEGNTGLVDIAHLSR